MNLLLLTEAWSITFKLLRDLWVTVGSDQEDGGDPMGKSWQKQNGHTSTLQRFTLSKKSGSEIKAVEK